MCKNVHLKYSFIKNVHLKYSFIKKTCKNVQKICISNIFGPNLKTCTWEVRAAWGHVSRGLTVGQNCRNIFVPFFGSNEDIQKSFWNELTFNYCSFCKKFITQKCWIYSKKRRCIILSLTDNNNKNMDQWKKP